jgi:pilus assembly protein CpaE
MPDDLNQLLKRARGAYKSGDRGKAAYYIDRILKQDFLHRGTWKLLYREYGSGLSFEEFQIEFTEQYYPDSKDFLRVGTSGRARVGRLKFKPQKAQSASSPVDSYPPKEPSTEKPIAASPEIKPAPPVKPVVLARSAQPSQPPASPLIVDRPTQPAVYLSQEPSAAPKPQSEIKPVPQSQKHPPASTKPLKKAEQPPATPPAASQPADKSPKIRVLVADDTAQTRETIIRSLSFQREVEVIATAENGIQAIELARQTKPDVVLMDVNMPDMDGITATTAILERTPFTQIVILTVQNDPDYMRRAMMAGARDFITKPPALDDLLNAVLQAGKIAHQEIRKAAQSSFGGLGTAPILSAQGKVITIYSPKGGTGCSTIVANLGVALHNEETNVLLVDGNLQYGDIGDLFNIRAGQTILDLAIRAYDLDIDIVEEALVIHESGLRILAPPGLEQAESVSGDQIIEILKYLRDLYPYVLVNTTSQLSDATIAALEVSNLIILLATQDISSITKVRRFLDTLNLLKIDRKRILLVLNQYDKNQEILPDMVGKSLKHEIAKLIPKDERVTIPAINRGIPFMLKEDLKIRPIARSVLDLAELVRRKLLELSTITEIQEKQDAQVH